MKGFLAFSLVYLAVAVAVAWLSGASREIVAFGIFAAFKGQLDIVLAALVPLALGIVAVGVLRSPEVIRRRGPEIVQALVGSFIFMAAFMTLKTHLQDIAQLASDQPFFADPLLAARDRALHFGFDPYQMTHAVFAGVPASAIAVIYVSLWLPFSILFPIVLAIFDGDQRRKRDYLKLYIIVFLVLGNVLAILALSAGPVFYDRIFDADRFNDLALALEASGLAGGFIGQVQVELWDMYAEGFLALGTGISAFPSVHVAMATVIALYVSERSVWLIPVAGTYLAAILVLSVHTGFHYAVDGYASIFLVAIAWRWLRRSRRSD